MDALLPPLLLSLRITVLATLVAVIIAVPLAYLHTRRRYFAMSLVEGLIVLPMVLPPTVVGYLIIMALGARGWPGRWLFARFDYSILFRIEGAVIAAALVAIPLIYLPTRAAFASVEREMEDIARINGAGTLQMFWHVSLPMAARGLASGLMLGFARALGEFGATAMVFGMQSSRPTLPISIYLDYDQGQMSHAWPAVILLIVISTTIALFYNRSTLSRQR
ncbi:MAG TPA: molybdate ABC transporter permease subunit [Tepidisphaeraceae bacterium]|nr:molybdate ABC transporter permease subunit [Tepidisphaeraceae bacterium]